MTSDEPDFSKTTAALVAHCDDFELGMGGTASKLVAQGWDFYVFVLASHRRRRSDKDADAADRRAQIREEEAYCGAETLGIRRTNVHFLRIGEDEDNRSVAGRIHRILESIFGTYRPSLPFLFTHSGHDRHADHVTCSLVASSAFRIPILKFAVASSTEADFQPDICVDISDHFDRKIDAFAQHRTQAELKAGARPIIDVLREFDSRTRRETGFIFSECFEVSHLAAGAELDPVLQLCDSPAHRQRLTAKLASAD